MHEQILKIDKIKSFGWCHRIFKRPPTNLFIYFMNFKNFIHSSLTSIYIYEWNSVSNCCYFWTILFCNECSLFQIATNLDNRSIPYRVYFVKSIVYEIIDFQHVFLSCCSVMLRHYNYCLFQISSLLSTMVIILYNFVSTLTPLSYQ